MGNLSILAFRTGIIDNMAQAFTDNTNLQSFFTGTTSHNLLFFFLENTTQLWSVSV